MEDLKISGIYCIENLINHKKYVGQAVNIRNRWYSHKSDFRNGIHSGSMFQEDWNIYGEDKFSFYVLQKCDKSDLNILETEWILKLNTHIEDYGYNSNTGGNSPMLNQKVRNKISEAKKELFKNPDFVEKNNKLRSLLAKDVYQIDLNGNIVKLWRGGCREAGTVLNIDSSGIYSAATKVNKTYKGYIWIYKEEYDLGKFNINEYVSNNGMLRNNIIVYQYNYTGMLVKKWENINVVKDIYDIESIRKSCNGTYCLYNDYLWSYIELSRKEVVQKYINQFPSSRPVLCLNHNILFYSLYDATKFAGLKKSSSSSIARAAEGIIKTSGKSPYTNEQLKWIWFNINDLNDDIEIRYYGKC